MRKLKAKKAKEHTKKSRKVDYVAQKWGKERDNKYMEDAFSFVI